MSRTKRKDRYIEKHGEPIFGDEWQATSDRKKWYKPSKKAKERLAKLHTDRDSIVKKAMRNPDEDGNVSLPPKKKTDTWYYN